MSRDFRITLGDLDLCDYPFALQFGSDLGNPENAVEVLASLLADGEIESLTRRTNREMKIPVLLEASDYASLAEAETALIAECDKQQNTLTVDPGDGLGAVTVFDVFAAQVVRAYDDDTETANFRQYVLTVRALPFGRSAGAIVDDAGTPPDSGGTLLYNCQSTTGWAFYGSLVNGGAVAYAVDSSIFSEGTGSLRSTAQAYYNPWVFGVTYAQNLDKVTGLSLSTGSGGYLTISIRTQNEGTYNGLTSGLQRLWMTTAAGEVEITSFASVSRSANGFVRYVWEVAAGLTVTGLRFQVDQYGNVATDTGTPRAWYDDVELLPATTTDHQIVKQLTVEGSARTAASLQVKAPSESIALSNVLIATMPTCEVPAGFQPDGRRWVTQGAFTADASALHGSYYTPDTTYSASSTAPAKPIFDVPVKMLTAGPYTMVALVKAESSTLTFGVQAQLRVGGASVGPTSEAEVSPTGLSLGWQFVVVGTVYLPPLPMESPGDDAKARLLFKGAKFADVYFIPAWQIGGRSVADFSIVDCGTGTVAPGGASSNLWIDSPSTSQPQGGWWRGPTVARANTQSAWPDAKKPGVHAFKPGSLTAFLVSTGAAGPSLTLEYTPAWYGMAAS